ncbi:MAG: ABC transporter ATP-binding protein [Treponemataceae bacterium]|nr:ABC transporter ATP-binding protein [Treponemataceae bacterium]
MIELVDFSKNYGKNCAVQNVSFTVQKGRIACLLGVNGAGKSTIIKAICGIHYPSGGKVLIEGISAEDQPILAKQKIGYVAENPQFYDFFTVEEFLHLMANIKMPNLSKNQQSEQAEIWAARCGLAQVMQKKIKTLSKGYCQRLAFACALLNNPPVLVLDEPITGLDPVQIQEMRALIKSLENEKTILLSTHLMQEVEALCTDIFILANHKLAASGTKEEILAQTNCQTLDQAFLQLNQNSTQ